MDNIALLATTAQINAARIVFLALLGIVVLAAWLSRDSKSQYPY